MSSLPPPPPGIPPPPRKKVPPPGEKGEVILLDAVEPVKTATSIPAPVVVVETKKEEPKAAVPKPAVTTTTTTTPTSGGGMSSVLAELQAKKAPTPAVTETKKDETTAPAPAPKPAAKVSPFGGGGMAGVLAELQAKTTPAPALTETKKEVAASPAPAPAPKPAPKVSPFGGGGGGMSGVLAELQAKRAPTPAISETKKEESSTTTKTAAEAPAPKPSAKVSPFGAGGGAGGMSGVLAELQAKRAPIPATNEMKKEEAAVPAPKPAVKVSPFGGGGMSSVLAELQAKKAPTPASNETTPVSAATTTNTTSTPKLPPPPTGKPAGSVAAAKPPASGGAGGMAGVLAELQAKRAPIPAANEMKKEEQPATTTAAAPAPAPKPAPKVSPFGGGMSGVLAELQAKKAPTPAITETKKEEPSPTAVTTPKPASAGPGGMAGVLAELQKKRPPVEATPAPSSTEKPKEEPVKSIPPPTPTPAPELEQKRAAIPAGTEREHPLSAEPPKKPPQPVSEQEKNLIPISTNNSATSSYQLPPPTTSSSPLASTKTPSQLQQKSYEPFQSEDLNHRQINVGPVLTDLGNLRKQQQELYFQQGGVDNKYNSNNTSSYGVVSSPPLNQQNSAVGIRPLGQAAIQTQQQQQQNIYFDVNSNSISDNNTFAANSSSLQHTPPRGPLRQATTMNSPNYNSQQQQQHRRDFAGGQFSPELGHPQNFTATDGLPMSLHAALSPMEVDRLHQLLEEQNQQQNGGDGGDTNYGSPNSAFASPRASEARKRILDLIGELHRLDENASKNARQSFDATPQTQLSQTELAIELNRVSDSFFGWLRRATMYSQGELHRHCEDEYAAAAGAISASCQPSSDIVLDANQRSAMRQILTSWRLMWVRARGEDEATLEQKIRDLQAKWFAVQNSEVAEHLHLGEVYLDQLRSLVGRAAELLPAPSRDPASAAISSQLATNRRDVLMRMQQDAAPRLRLDPGNMMSPQSNRSSAAASWIRLHGENNNNNNNQNQGSPLASPYASRTAYRGNERNDLIGVSYSANRNNNNSNPSTVPYTTSLNEALGFRKGLERALNGGSGTSNYVNDANMFSPSVRGYNNNSGKPGWK